MTESHCPMPLEMREKRRKTVYKKPLLPKGPIIREKEAIEETQPIVSKKTVAVSAPLPKPKAQEAKETKSSPTPVFDAGGRRMATIRGRVFQKSVDGSKHFLRVPPSVAMDARVHDDHAPLFDAIEITDRETGDVWTISRADFDAHRAELNRGYGPQYAVVFAHWSKNGQPPRGVPQAGPNPPGAKAPPPPSPQQSLGLFD